MAGQAEKLDHDHKNTLVLKVLDLVPKYHTLEQTWPRRHSSVGNSIGLVSQRSRVRFHRGQS